MAERFSMEVVARKVFRDTAAARRRSLCRRVAGPLFRKYLGVVPSVFTANGEFAAFRLLVAPRDARRRLRDRIVLTLDSATEVLAGFRFGKSENIFGYFDSADHLAAVERERIGVRLPGSSFPLSWPPPQWRLLFAVRPRTMPPCRSIAGVRVVTWDQLVRELIGFYGLRAELLARLSCFEARVL
jgi:hypothetical protein